MIKDFFNDMLNVVMVEAKKEENIEKFHFILDPYIVKIERKFYFFIILLYLIYVITLIIIIYILFYYKNNIEYSVPILPSCVNSITSVTSDFKL
jgi:hypothetical protein